MKALVFGEIYPFRIQALLVEYQEGEPILGMFVQIKNGDKLIIGKVVNFHRTSDIVKEHVQTKHINQNKNSIIVQTIVNDMEGIILDIDLITAFQNGERVPLNFPLTLLSEVHFLKDLPVELPPYTGYLGYLHGTEIKSPLILEDFQTMKEAYHFFVAGRSGTGKSTLTQKLLALYNKNNPNMNFLILDTVGEFTASFEGKGDLFLHLKDIWKGEVEIYIPPENLALEGWDMFKEICLEYKVMKELDIPAKSEENTSNGINAIINLLRGKEEDRSTRHITPNIVESVLKQLAISDEIVDWFVKKVYSSSNESRDRVRNAIKNPIAFKSFVEKIKEVAELFCTVNTKKRTIQEVVKDFSEAAIKGKVGKCVVLNFTLYKTVGHSKNLRTKYVRETLRALYSEGIKLYNQRGNINLNTLTILEEAHNYVPKYADNEELKNLSDEIVTYSRETRKFGIGWLYITIRPSDVRREIFENTMVRLIGPGLTSGPDAELLRETFGSEFLNLYRLLPNPNDKLSPSKKVNFVVSGPITLLSIDKPEFITVFNNKDEFLKSNGF